MEELDLEKYYLAFVLDEESRSMLLREYPATYERLVCHHVTIAFSGVSEQMVADWQNKKLLCQLMRRYCKDGVECFSVMLGNTLLGPNYQRFHITHSLAAGKKAVQSNDLLFDIPVIDSETTSSEILTGSVQLLRK